MDMTDVNCLPSADDLSRLVDSKDADTATMDEETRMALVKKIGTKNASIKVWIDGLPRCEMSRRLVSVDVRPTGFCWDDVDVPVLEIASGAVGVASAAAIDCAIAALSAIPAAANDWSSDQVRAHRADFDRALRPRRESFVAHQALDILREMLPADGILAYDVGAHTHQIASQWRTDRPRTLLATNGWSSMGYAMPSAFAAKLVHPDRAVACVVGDGGFQMTAGELALARRLNLASPVIVLNDGWLGLMKVKQEKRSYPLSGVRLGAPPESPAHYFGVPCRAAKTPDDFRRAFAWATALGGPSVIEAFIDADGYSPTVFD